MKKKKKIILVILIVLAIILVICFSILNKYKNAEKKYETEIVDGQYTQQDLDIIQESVESYVSDKVVPTGISKLYGKYKGENELSDLYRGIKKVSDYIPLISEKLNGKSDADIKKYYDANKKEVTQNTGIIKSEDFVNFAKYILEFNLLKTLSSSAIMTDTISADEDFLMFDLKLVYEDNQEVIIKTYFKNVDDEQDELFKFSITEN